MAGGQLLRIVTSIVWCLVSLVLGVWCVSIDHWVTHILGLGCAFSCVVAGYITKQEWALL